MRIQDVHHDPPPVVQEGAADDSIRYGEEFRELEEEWGVPRGANPRHTERDVAPPGSVLAKIAGMLWAGSVSTLEGLETEIMDPHSVRTVRLTLVLCVLGTILLALSAFLFVSWWTTTRVDRAIQQGHADARAYRVLTQHKKEQKKKA